MRSSHETAEPALVERAHHRGAGAIHWLEELGCEFTRENGGYRLARCGGASRKRLLQVGDRTGHAITKALREAYEAGERRGARPPRLTALEPGDSGLAGDASRRRTGRDAVDAARSCSAAGGRCYAEAESAASSRRTTPTRRAR